MEDGHYGEEAEYGFCGYLLIIISVILIVITFPFSLLGCLKVSIAVLTRPSDKST